MIKWIVLPVVSALLWRWGGMCWKPARRYLLPIFTTIYAYTKHKKKWKSLFLLLGMGSLSMGYGENHSWADRVLFTFLVVLPTFFLGWSVWQIIFPVVFLGGFYLSNEHGTAELWKWHNLELFAFGPAYGCLIASVL